MDPLTPPLQLICVPSLWQQNLCVEPRGSRWRGVLLHGWMDGVERGGSAPVQGGRNIAACAFTLESWDLLSSREAAMCRGLVSLDMSLKSFKKWLCEACKLSDCTVCFSYFYIWWHFYIKKMVCISLHTAHANIQFLFRLVPFKDKC